MREGSRATHRHSRKISAWLCKMVSSRTTEGFEGMTPARVSFCLGFPNVTSKLEQNRFYCHRFMGFLHDLQRVQSAPAGNIEIFTDQSNTKVKLRISAVRFVRSTFQNSNYTNVRQNTHTHEPPHIPTSKQMLERNQLERTNAHTVNPVE